MAKRNSQSWVPYSVIAIILVLGVAAFIKIGTGGNTSDVLGFYTTEAVGQAKMSLKDKIGSFFKGGQKKTGKKARNLGVERKQRVSDWVREIDSTVDDGGEKEFKDFQIEFQKLQ